MNKICDGFHSRGSRIVPQTRHRDYRPVFPKSSCIENKFQIPKHHGFELDASILGPNDANKLPDENNDKMKFIYSVFGVGIIATLAYFISTGAISGVNINEILQDAVKKIESLGPYGFLYFAAFYIAAEVLAIPALPLTASSGYLFGLLPGAATVIISATIAATISFFIGRTLLRGWAKKIADGNAKWRALDSVIGREGFKVVLLLRLSPLLPFAISNYLYGVTAVDYWSYVTASFLGFIPGTLGIVYAGSAGKDLLASAGHDGLPWYAYAIGVAALAVGGKVLGKVATDAIAAMEEADAAEKGEGNAPDKKAPAPSTNGTSF